MKSKEIKSNKEKKLQRKNKKIIFKKINKIEKKDVNKNKKIKNNLNEIDKTKISKISKLNKKKQTGKIESPLRDPKNNVIEIRGVKKIYTSGKIATLVLRGIDLEIKKGEICILFGKSGSGKSTLLNLISGLDRVTEGEIIIKNNDITKMSDKKMTKFRRINMGFIFQKYNLLGELTAYDNVETGSFLEKNKDKKLDIEKLFEMMEISDVMKKFPSEMSGGQQQRVSIARAIIKNPDILFADEPTGALDEKMSAIVMDILQKINKKYGTTIIIVSHNPAAKKIANTSVTLRMGKISEIYKNKKIESALDVEW